MITPQSNTGQSNPDISKQSARFHKRLRHEAVQAAVIAVAILLIALFAYSVESGLAQHGIKFSFSFLWDTAGFDISEGKTLSLRDDLWPIFTAFTSDRTIADAFVTGVFNTVKVAIIAIIASTILGTLLGVGRLSTNWLVQKLSFWIVEFIRNTPLLIQLVFWYFAVVLHFPPIADAAKFYGGILISQQGFYFPSLYLDVGNSIISIGLISATLVSILGAVLDKTKEIRRICVRSAAALFCLSLITGILKIDYPVASKFQANGGTNISPEMAALLLAIVVNSASYIAEIVRGAIDSLPKGQWEAASSLGLTRSSTVNDIILPQVFRVVLPSFGNQYISLTKNTAMGIAIGYPDLFNIYGTIANQTGHSLEGIIIVMLTYLLLSWLISAAVTKMDRRLNRIGATK